VRRFLSAKTRLAISAAVAVGVVAGCSAWFINRYFWIEAHTVKERLWPPPTFEQIEVKQLRNIAGWFSLDCGYVRRFAEADPTIACAQQALRMKRRFYLAFTFVAFDSQWAYGLAAGRSGVVYEVVTEHGSFFSVPKAAVNRCETPPIEKTVGRSRYLTCWTAAADKAMGW